MFILIYSNNCSDLSVTHHSAASRFRHLFSETLTDQCFLKCDHCQKFYFPSEDLLTMHKEKSTCASNNSADITQSKFPIRQSARSHVVQKSNSSEITYSANKKQKTSLDSIVTTFPLQVDNNDSTSSSVNRACSSPGSILNESSSSQKRRFVRIEELLEFQNIQKQQKPCIVPEGT